MLVVLLAFAVAGCTSDDDPVDEGRQTDPGDPDTAGGNGTLDNITRETVQVTVTWSGVYLVSGAYTPTTVRVPANSTVELTFVNDEQNPTVSHDLVVEGIEGASTSVLEPGETSDPITFDVDAPMETKFFCSLGNHRENGMEGDFIIE